MLLTVLPNVLFMMCTNTYWISNFSSIRNVAFRSVHKFWSIFAFLHFDGTSDSSTTDKKDGKPQNIIRGWMLTLEFAIPNRVNQLSYLQIARLTLKWLMHWITTFCPPIADVWNPNCLFRAPLFSYVETNNRFVNRTRSIKSEWQNISSGCTFINTWVHLLFCSNARDTRDPDHTGLNCDIYVDS